MIPRYLSIRLLPLLLAAFTIAMVGPAAADETWIDQFKNTVLFYQQSDPTTDWQPYLDKVATIRAGLAANDEAAVQPAEGELIGMLTMRANGINDAAADDLFQMITSRELEPSNEMPVSVPDHSINTPYEGGRPCLADGCDYWRDDVFDAGAG
jgi:hypothetical protein